MAATFFVTDGKIGIDLTATYASTSAGSSSLWPAKPGDTVTTTNDGVFMFARAQSTVGQYDCVVFGSFEDSAAATTAEIVPRCMPITDAAVAGAGVAGFGKVGIAQTAIASANYGWIALKGYGLRVNTLIACQPNVPLFTNGATPGSLDDSVKSTSFIAGITITTSATSASAPRCIANWPHVALYAVQA